MSDATSSYETTIDLDDEELEVRIEFEYDPGRPARLYPPPGDPAEGPEITEYNILLWVEGVGWTAPSAEWQEQALEALGGDDKLCARLLDSLGSWGA